MKKLLGILAVLGFSVTTTASVVACGCKLKEENQKVVDRIIKADNVESTVDIDTSANSLVQMYDGEFIANFLDSETKEIFQVEDFNTLKVTKENGGEILNADLAKPNAELKAKLNFNYGFVKNQILDLTIKVKKEDELIAQEISAASYSLKPESFKATPDDVINQINENKATFIKEKIDHAGIFDSDKYKTKKVLVNDHDLDLKDLKTTKSFSAKIIFDYGDKENQETNLTIQGVFQNIQTEPLNKIYVGQSTELTITNYEALKEGNPTIDTDDEKVQVEDHKDGTATLTAKQEGNAEIIINADNAEKAVTLTLEIIPKIAIEAELKQDEIHVGETTKVIITNYDAFEEEYKPTIKTDEKVQVEDRGDGTATLTAINVGTSIITINSDIAQEPKILTLKIAPRLPKKAQGANVSLKLTETRWKEKLTKVDQKLVRNEIIVKLREANKDAVIENDTFSDFDLAEVISTTDKISVNVKGTDSTLEKPGLKEGKVDVTLNLSPLAWDIAELLKGKTELGYVPKATEATNAATNIINSIPQLNGHVILGKPENGIITVKPGDNTLQGSAQFTYQVQSDIGELLKGKTELGYVPKATEATNAATNIINSIPQLNGHVILGKPENGIITVKPGDNTLQGSAQFTYQVQSDIGELLKGKTELGYVPKATEATNAATNIINSIPQLNGHVILGKPENGIITVKPGDNTLQGSAQFTYQVQSNIADLLKGQTELGYVPKATEATNAATNIINSIPQLNGHVILGKPENGIITVKPGDNTLQGSAQFTYQVQSNIADLLKGQTELGYVPKATEATNAATNIINSIPQLNGHVILGKPENGIITVKPGDNTLQGSAQFTYQVQSNIADLLKGQTELGYVNKNEDALEIAQTIILELKLQWHVALGEPENGIITVKPGDDTLQGYTEFTFNLTDDIEKIIPEKKLDLGDVESEDAAIKKMKNVLAEVKLTNKVTWSLNQIKKTIRVIPIDENLFGAVEFRYQLK